MMVDIIYHLIVYTVRKIAVAKASYLTLSSMLLFAELLDSRRLIRGSSHSTSQSNSRSPNYRGRKSEISRSVAMGQARQAIAWGPVF